MEKYIVTENTVQYFEGSTMIWEEVFNSKQDRNNVINHLEEMNANYTILTANKADQLATILESENIEYDQFDGNIFTIDAPKYAISIEIDEDGINLYTTNHTRYTNQAEQQYGETSKANGNYKTVKTLKAATNYIMKYWEA